MTIVDEGDIAALRVIGQIVARCLKLMAESMRPGMTTAELDAIGERYLAEQGATSAPRATYDFPGTTCISVNEEVAHGVPGDRKLARGDLVNIDVSGERDGYWADTGGSFPVEEMLPHLHHLCETTRRALNAAMRNASAGKPLRGIGKAIETQASAAGFSIVRNLCSHGVGRALHEEPEFIPGYDDPKERRMLHYGQVITIEPFLTTGDSWVDTADDGWTLFNRAGSRSAQYEHTLVITNGRPLVMTVA
jgi:methionyl aminopeptidase